MKRTFAQLFFFGPCVATGPHTNDVQVKYFDRLIRMWPNTIKTKRNDFSFDYKHLKRNCSLLFRLLTFDTVARFRLPLLWLSVFFFLLLCLAFRANFLVCDGGVYALDKSQNATVKSLPFLFIRLRDWRELIETERRNAALATIFYVFPRPQRLIVLFLFTSLIESHTDPHGGWLCV